MTERNIGGARNTAPERANGFSTSHNITGSGPEHNKSAEEALRHQEREKSTLI